MSLFVNAPAREEPSVGIFSALGGLIASVPGLILEVGEKAGDLIKQQEISTQLRESRDQVFTLVLVLGALFLLSRR